MRRTFASGAAALLEAVGPEDAQPPAIQSAASIETSASPRPHTEEMLRQVITGIRCKFVKQWEEPFDFMRRELCAARLKTQFPNPSRLCHVSAR